MTEQRSEAFYANIMHALSRVFAKHELTQPECVLICAQLTSLAVHSSPTGPARQEQVDMIIRMILDPAGDISLHPG